MNKISKKEIRHAVTDAMNQTLSKFSISTPSKKTQRLIDDVSRKVSGRIKSEVKKLTRKPVESTKGKNGKRAKAAKGGEKLAAA